LLNEVNQYFETEFVNKPRTFVHPFVMEAAKEIVQKAVNLIQEKEESVRGGQAKREEFEKILSSYETVKRAADDGTLDRLLPEWAEMKDCPQSGPHKFTVGGHTLRAIEVAETMGYGKDVADRVPDRFRDGAHDARAGLRAPAAQD